MNRGQTVRSSESGYHAAVAVHETAYEAFSQDLQSKG